LIVSNVAFGKTVVLDSVRFEEASRKLEALSEEMASLKERIQTLLDELKAGFATPAGDKFFAACGSNLIQPLDDQARVIAHISQNLSTAREMYQSVFKEHQTLENLIKNAQTQF